VVTYQLLSGRLPYEATSLSELALKQQRESPTPLDELNPQVPPQLAQAVAMTLATDQESRPADAMVLADALRNGAHGLAPLGATAQTAHLGTGAATRVLSSEDDRTAATRIAARTPPPRSARQLEPIPGPHGQPARPAARATAAPRRAERRRGLRRFLVFLAIVLLFTAAVGAAIVITTSNSKQAVQIRRVVGNDAQSAINSLRDLINSNTK
jgi:serine/threonine-protein kinase